MNSFDLTGKTAVITGGAGIICKVMAEEMAKAGVKVALLDIFGEKAQEVADGINASGGTAIAFQTNVLERSSIEAARSYVLEKFGHVDILINGAGGNKKEASTGEELSFFELPTDALRWVFDLNVTGAVLTTQVFGELFAQSKKGCIVNVSSMSAILPLTKTIAYSAAKAAVSNFTQWMAVHFNQNYSTDIRVNAIAPGFLLTAQNEFLLKDKEGNPTPRGQSVIAKTPMGRYGSPDELVGAVMWLCSDAASFVNGAVIPIDGGFSAYWGV